MFAPRPRTAPWLFALCSFAAGALFTPVPASAAPAPGLRVLVNHLGYDLHGSKKFVVQAEQDTEVASFEVIEAGGKVVREGLLGPRGEPARLTKVDNWKRWRFLRGDFTALSVPGVYRIRVRARGGEVWSTPFTVAAKLLPEAALSDLIFYFKSQRATDTYDRADRAVPFFGNRARRADVHGGWYDASGDVSKYLSHLSYANFMNPQQAPFAVWAMLEAAETLAPVKNLRWKGLGPRLLDEALHGADFLVRMQDPAGFFYLTVFDNWSHDPAKREICAYETKDGKKTADYQAGMREGGGLAIAALARASTVVGPGEYPARRYLAVAEKGWAHLATHNRKYIDDGQENIIDDYTALLAATELYAATRKRPYLEAARTRRAALLARLHRDATRQGFWVADAKGQRPYFHAAEAGLPVVALARYRKVEPDATVQKTVLEAMGQSLDFELAITAEVNNPFGYARQYVKDLGGGTRSSFFFPHKNESGYWWQGESARQGSLATAAFTLAQLVPERAAALGVYATDQLDWIFGLNPFDACMVQGKGRNNVEYELDWPNAPGGVVNGITSGWDDERDIAFLPEPQAQDPAQRWRWSEQWIPHGAWLMLALSAQAALPTVKLAAAGAASTSASR